MSGHVLAPGDVIGRLLLGAVLGIIIGVERQWRQRSAGLHTCALVAAGATLFAVIVPVTTGGIADVRILANIATGVGFLAGGVIVRDGVSVRGLNTAATMWATAAVGSLAGVGLAWEAAAGTTVIVGLNLLLQPIVGILDRSGGAQHNETIYRISVTCSVDALTRVRTKILEIVSRTRLALQALTDVTRDDQQLAVSAELVQSLRNDALIENLSNELRAEPGVKNVAWYASDV